MEHEQRIRLWRGEHDAVLLFSSINIPLSVCVLDAILTSLVNQFFSICG
jgi:hypothetical protein